MRYVLATVGLVLGLTFATRGGSTVQPTTQPRTEKAGCLREPELLDLADYALALEKPVKGVDRYWLVALALHESSGNPTAVGDFGMAVGLHQFHVPAWADCWGDPGTCLVPRTDPLYSFRAAIRYAGKVKRYVHCRRAAMSSHHHLGHVNLHDEVYIAGVERKYQQLVKQYGGAACTKP